MKPYKLTLPAVHSGESILVGNQTHRPLIVETPGVGTVELEPGSNCIEPIKSWWRPIDTAPRDGDPIDLWCGNRRIPDCTWEITGTIRPAGYEGTEGWRSESRDYETREKPTFWMPTPKPPG